MNNIQNHPTTGGFAIRTKIILHAPERYPAIQRMVFCRAKHAEDLSIHSNAWFFVFFFFVFSFLVFGFQGAI